MDISFIKQNQTNSRRAENDSAQSEQGDPDIHTELIRDDTESDDF